MIQEFIDRFQEVKPQLLKNFSETAPSSYKDTLVQTLTLMFAGDNDYDKPNPDNIHVIDDGDYQGTLLFIIPERSYQPSTYWAVSVDYGSCSGCDTFQSYATYDDSKDSAPEMVTMALHMIESMKEV